MRNTLKISLILVGVIAIATACSPQGETQRSNANTSAPAQNTAPAKPQATPSNKFTTADVAKLKWIEGSWRGMDGQTPFYERYKVEESAMVVEGLKEDGSPDGEPGRFELKNGEFGKGEGDKRAAASEITDSYIQFVPAVAGTGNNFRFERQSDGSWIAVLDWPAKADKPAGQKVYRMERWQPTK